MTEQAISPLRRRMIEDMTIRKFAQKTQRDSVQRVAGFGKLYGAGSNTKGCSDGASGLSCGLPSGPCPIAPKSSFL